MTVDIIRSFAESLFFCQNHGYQAKRIKQFKVFGTKIRKRGKEEIGKKKQNIKKYLWTEEKKCALSMKRKTEELFIQAEKISDM